METLITLGRASDLTMGVASRQIDPFDGNKQTLKPNSID
jgi:hypothetical protein